ncbi:MAG: serine/threonine protein kinase [Verrucomicrobiales bacterium]|jgi:serine/threonine protein kinase
MNEPEICPTCGKPIPTNAPMGVCPNCLIAVTGDTEIIGKFDPPKPEELADKFPQLEILELIGRGGMGAVYKVRQRELDRVVALKILPPGIGEDPAFAERFSREARALAKLNHPNIVTLYEFGDADGLYFFLMEFVDGVNLRDALNAGKFTPKEALAIVPPICEAVQFAHDAGVVHRDIKPENLLLDKEGKIKIADFGIARMMGNRDETHPAAAGESEQTTLPVGTPRYMAPEQTEDGAAPDHRVDIYALGVVLYELLTGETPKGSIAAPSKKVEVDVRIDEIVLRALEAKPELRFASAADMQTEIETVVGSIDVRPPSRSNFPIRTLLWISGSVMALGSIAFGLALFPDLFTKELNLSEDSLNLVAVILFVLLSIPVLRSTIRILNGRSRSRSFAYSFLPAILVIGLLGVSLLIMVKMRAPKPVGGRVVIESPEGRFQVAAQTMHVDPLIGGGERFFVNLLVHDNDGGNAFRQVDLTNLSFPDLPKLATPESYDLLQHGTVVWEGDETVSIQLRGQQLLRFDLGELEINDSGQYTEAAISLRANRFVEELSQARFHLARSRFSQGVLRHNQFDDTKNWWTKIETELGALKLVETPILEGVSEHTWIAMVPCEFERGRIEVRVAFDSIGLVDAFSTPGFKPLELGPVKVLNLGLAELEKKVYLDLKSDSIRVGEGDQPADISIGVGGWVELFQTDIVVPTFSALDVAEHRLMSELMEATWSADSGETSNISGTGSFVFLFRTRLGDRGIIQVESNSVDASTKVSYRLLVPDAHPENQVARAYQFSPVIDIELIASDSYDYCLVNLDTRKVIPLPKEVLESAEPGSAKNWPEDANIASFMRAAGADLALRWSDPLEIHQVGGIVGLMAENTNLEEVRVDQVRAWNRKIADMASVQDHDSGAIWRFQPNAVSTFRTRGGELGILQILSEDGKRLSFRYRLVRRID